MFMLCALWSDIPTYIYIYIHISMCISISALEAAMLRFGFLQHMCGRLRFGTAKGMVGVSLGQSRSTHQKFHG